MCKKRVYILVTMLVYAGLSPPLYAQDTLKTDTIQQSNKPATSGSEQIFDADELPVPIKKVSPSYPISAKVQNITGKVVVKVLIGTDGIPKDAQILRSDSKILNDAAIEAVMQWRFKPATSKGKPIVYWAVIPFQFSLQR